MTKEDEKELLSCIRELSNRDVVINTFLKASEVDARMTMIGERVSRDYLDDVIIANGLKSMIKSILLFQAKRIEGLNEELKEAHINKVTVLKVE